MPTADFLFPKQHSPALRRFVSLLDPLDDARLEALARESAAVTRRHFGKAIRLFAPLYLSNECINNCHYCGFSRDNAILRVTLDVESVVKEARHLAAEGFRNVLLVAGEHPRFVSNGYLEACVRALAPEVPSVAIEVAPMEASDYARLVAAGAEGLIVYQETYDRPRARVRSWLSPDRSRRAFRPQRMAGRSDGARTSPRISAAPLLARAIHREPAAAAAMRGQLRAAAPARRS